MKDLFKNFLSALIIFILLNSCKTSENAPSLQKCLISEIKTSGKDNYFNNTVISYNDSNLPIIRKDTSPISYYITKFDYNSSNQIIKFSYNRNGDINPTFIKNFTYDSKNNLLTNIRTYPDSHSDTLIYEYDSNGLVIKRSAKGSGYFIPFTERFEYDNNSNLLKIFRTYKNSSEYLLDEYKNYDDKPNFLNQWPVSLRLILFGDDIARVNSKNNYADAIFYYKSGHLDGHEVYNYKYDDKNLITSWTETDTRYSDISPNDVISINSYNIINVYKCK